MLKMGAEDWAARAVLATHGEEQIAAGLHQIMLIKLGASHKGANEQHVDRRRKQSARPVLPPLNLVDSEGDFRECLGGNTELMLLATFDLLPVSEALT